MITNSYTKNFCTEPGEQEDSCFYGRDEYIDRIHKYIHLGKHCALRADRQYGKTALGYKAIKSYKKDAIGVIIDLHRTSTINELRNMIMKSFVDKFLGYGKVVEIITSLTSSLLSKVSERLSAKIKIEGIEIAIKDSSLQDLKAANISFVDTLIIIDTICQAKDKKFILFLDEIHKLTEMTSEYEHLASLLRSNIPKLKNISFIIAGSELSILDDMINENVEARYLMQFEAINVYGIKEEYYTNHLLAACKERKISIVSDVPKSIISITNGIASSLSYFGSKLLDNNSSINIYTVVDIIFMYYTTPICQDNFL